MKKYEREKFIIFDKKISKLFFAFDYAPNLFSEMFFRNIQEEINNLSTTIDRKIK